jgi:uncharacterized protein YkwD
MENIKKISLAAAFALLLPTLLFAQRGDIVQYLQKMLVAPAESATKTAAEAEDASLMGQMERAVLQEINWVRSDPQGYANQILVPLLSRFEGQIYIKPDGSRTQTYEGVATVHEAISVLRNTKPMGLLRASRGLSLAARDHARDMSTQGDAIGHYGTDNSSLGDRAARYGAFSSLGESVARGSSDAREFVLQNLLDDNVPSRGHRALLLSPNFTQVGIAVEKSSAPGSVCVIDYANGYLSE